MAAYGAAIAPPNPECVAFLDNGFLPVPGMHGGVFDHDDGAQPPGFPQTNETDSRAAVVDRAARDPSREKPVGERVKKHCG